MSRKTSLRRTVAAMTAAGAVLAVSCGPAEPEANHGSQDPREPPAAAAADVPDPEAVLADYGVWLHTWDREHDLDAGLAWLDRLRAAAQHPEPALRDRCRIQLIALLNTLGMYEESEIRIKEHTASLSDAWSVAVWKGELAEIRLIRVLRNGEELDDEETLGLVLDGITAIQQAFFMTADVDGQPDLVRRLFVAIWQLPDLVELGIVEAGEAIRILSESEALVAVLEGSVEGWTAPYSSTDFARIALDVKLLAPDVAFRERLKAVENYAVRAPNKDLATLRFVQLWETHGDVREREFVESGSEWLERYPVDGPNGVLLRLYLARARLSLAQYQQVLAGMDASLGHRPGWAKGAFRGSWSEMQYQLAVVCLAAARAGGSTEEQESLAFDYAAALDLGRRSQPEGIEAALEALAMEFPHLFPSAGAETATNGKERRSDR
jgi:hypothetical protein